ncbi:MAG: hypothetical protein HUU32_02125 [Calditrichaceae bacterium]|nr:hypothetical protein [Calditrichia bacterium]NUQ40173.1 hypothetical protein [Calditrichaceae bacterium]
MKRPRAKNAPKAVPGKSKVLREPKRPEPPRKKTVEKQRRSPARAGRNAYYLKQGVQQALYVVTVFLALILLSLAFLLYQWKEYKIVEFNKDIQKLKSEVLRLESEVSRRQAQVNSQLTKYHRVAQISGEKLGLKPTVEEPLIFKVDKKSWRYYVGKDRQADQ